MYPCHWEGSTAFRRPWPMTGAPPNARLLVSGSHSRQAHTQPLIYLPLPRRIDLCAEHKFNKCRKCTLSTQGDALVTKNPCALEGTILPNEVSCKAKSQFYCQMTGTCVDECASCFGNNKPPLEGRYFYGTNTCSPAPPEFPWTTLSSEKVCGSVDTVRSDQLKGITLKECQKACEDNAECMGVDFFAAFGNCNIYTKMCQNPTKGNPDQQPSSYCLRNCCVPGTNCDDFNYVTMDDKCQATSDGPKCVGSDPGKFWTGNGQLLYIQEIQPGHLATVGSVYTAALPVVHTVPFRRGPPDGSWQPS